MIGQLLAEFWRDLSAQRTRAFLTLFAVFWGALTVVLLLSFGEGLKRAVVDGSLGAGQQMFIVYGGQTTKPYDGLPAGRQIHLTERDLEVLQRSIPQIDLTSPSYGRSGTVLRTAALTTTTMMEGVDPGFSEMRTMYPAAGGRFLDEKDVALRRRVLFLGDSIAARLFPGLDPVGLSVELDGLPFTVVGVMEPKLQTSMNNGPDDDRAIIPASTFRAIYGPKWVSSLLIRPRDVNQAGLVKRRIYEVLGAVHKFDPDDQHALSMWDFIEDVEMTRRIGLGIEIFLGVVGALTLLVAGVGVGNIMIVVVRERTREIGIKRAVGAHRRHIMAQFLFEALLVCLLGGGAGLLLGASIIFGVDGIRTGNQVMQFIGHPILSWPIALVTTSILVFVGLAAGVFPARRAARLDPVESLRYE